MAAADVDVDMRQLTQLKQQRKSLKIQQAEVKKDIKKESKRLQKLKSSAKKLSVADLVEVLRMKGSETAAPVVAAADPSAAHVAAAAAAS